MAEGVNTQECFLKIPTRPLNSEQTYGSKSGGGFAHIFLLIIGVFTYLIGISPVTTSPLSCPTPGVYVSKGAQLLFTSGVSAQVCLLLLLATTCCHCWTLVRCRCGSWPAHGLLLWCCCLWDRRRSPLPTCQAWPRMLGTSRGKSKSGVRATSSPFLFGGHLAKRWGIPSTKDLVLSGQWGWCYLNNFRDIFPGKNHYSKRIYFEPQLCHFKYLFLKAKSLLGELHYLPWT